MRAESLNKVYFSLFIRALERLKYFLVRFRNFILYIPDMQPSIGRYRPETAIESRRMHDRVRRRHVAAVSWRRSLQCCAD